MTCGGPLGIPTTSRRKKWEAMCLSLIFDTSNCDYVQRLWKQWISFWYRILRLFADHSTRDGVWHGGGLLLKNRLLGNLLTWWTRLRYLELPISLSLQKCEINKAKLIPQISQELILILILCTVYWCRSDLKFSASMALLDSFRSSRFACFSRWSRTLRLRRCVDFRRTGWSADDYGSWMTLRCAYLKVYWEHEVLWYTYTYVSRESFREFQNDPKGNFAILYLFWWGSIWCHLSARWFNGWIAFVKTGRLAGE